MLALTGHQARRWEPKRMRVRVFSITGRITRSARRTRLRLAAHGPSVLLVIHAIRVLRRLPSPHGGSWPTRSVPASPNLPAVEAAFT